MFTGFACADPAIGIKFLTFSLSTAVKRLAQERTILLLLDQSHVLYKFE